MLMKSSACVAILLAVVAVHVNVEAMPTGDEVVLLDEGESVVQASQHAQEAQSPDFSAVDPEPATADASEKDGDLPAEASDKGDVSTEAIQAARAAVDTAHKAEEDGKTSNEEEESPGTPPIPVEAKLDQSKLAPVDPGVTIDPHEQAMRISHRADSDGVEAKVRMAKLTTLDNQQQLRQIRHDAHTQQREAAQIQTKVDEAEALARQKAHVEQAMENIKAAKGVLSEVALRKQQVAQSQSRLHSVMNKIEAHKSEMTALRKKMAAVKKEQFSIKLEDQQKSLRDIQVRRSTEKERLRNDEGVLRALYKSQNTTAVQSSHDGETVQETLAKTKMLKAQLEAEEDNTMKKEGHLRKVANAAAMNTVVQSSQMSAISRQFNDQITGLEQRVDALKQSIAEKKAHLRNFQKKEGQQHEDAANQQSKLQQLTAEIHERSLDNTALAKRGQQSVEAVDNDLAELKVESARTQAQMKLQKSKNTIVDAKVEAVREAHQESQANDMEDIKAAETDIAEAKAEMAILSTKKKAMEDLIKTTNLASVKLMRDLETLKLEIAPEAAKEKTIQISIEHADQKNAAAVKAKNHWITEYQSVKKKTEDLLASQTALAGQLAESKGKLDAMKQTVEARRAEKEDQKLATTKAVEKLKTVSVAFEGLAKKASDSESDIKDLQQQQQTAGDEVSHVKSSIVELQGNHAAKMAKLKETYEALKEEADKSGETAKTLRLATAKVMAELALTERHVSDGKVTFAKQKRHWATSLQSLNTAVADLSNTFKQKQVELNSVDTKLQTFKNHAQAEVLSLQSKYAVGEKVLQGKAKAAVSGAKTAQQNVEVVQRDVESQLQATISRERKMEEVRKAGISKLESYATAVDEKMQSEGEAQTEEEREFEAKKQKLQQLTKAETKDETAEQSAQSREEADVKELESKEVQTKAADAEKAKEEVRDLVNVKGAKADQALVQALGKDNIVKRQIAQTAGQISEVAAETKQKAKKVMADDELIEEMKAEKRTLSKKLNSVQSKLADESTLVQHAAAKDTEAHKRLAAVTKAIQQKQALLAKMTEAGDADADQMRTLHLEITNDQGKVKKLKFKLQNEMQMVQSFDRKAGKLGSSISALSKKAMEAKAKDLADKEALNLERLKAQDEEGDVEQEKSQANILKQEIKLAAHKKAQLAAERAKLGSNLHDAKRQRAQSEEAKANDEDALSTASIQMSTAEQQLKNTEGTLKIQSAKEAEVGAENSENEKRLSADKQKLQKILARLSVTQKEEMMQGRGPKMSAELRKKLVAEMHQADVLKERLREDDDAVHVARSNAIEDKQKLKEEESEMQAEKRLRQHELSRKGHDLDQAASDIQVMMAKKEAEQIRKKKLSKRLKATYYHLTMARGAKLSSMKKLIAAKGAVGDMHDQMSNLDQKLAVDKAEETADEAALAKTQQDVDAMQSKTAKEAANTAETKSALEKSEALLKNDEANEAEKKKKKLEEDEELAQVNAKLTEEEQLIQSQTEASRQQTQQERETMSKLEQEEDSRKKDEKVEELQMQNAANAKSAADIQKSKLKQELDAKEKRLQSKEKDAASVSAEVKSNEQKAKDLSDADASAKDDISKSKGQARNEALTVQLEKVNLKKMRSDEKAADVETKAEITEMQAKAAEAAKQTAHLEHSEAEQKEKTELLEKDTQGQRKKWSTLQAEMFRKERELESIKKKETVMKAFLTGPVLGPDAETPEEQKDAEANEEPKAAEKSAEDPGSKLGASLQMASLPTLPNLTP